MGNDLPDGTKKITIAFSGGFVGLEELSARHYWVGIVLWNMLGNVFLVDSFYDGIDNWVTSTSGAGSSAARSDDYYVTLAVSLKLVSSNVAGAYARATRLLPHLGDKKYGFSCLVSIEQATPG